MKASLFVASIVGMVGEAAAHERCRALIQKGEVEDDLNLTAVSAAAKLGELTAGGLKPETARELVKGLIAEGKCTDDLGAGEADANAAVIDAAIADLNKEPVRIEKGTPEPLIPAGATPDLGALTKGVEQLAAGVDEMVAQSRAAATEGPILRKGVVAALEGIKSLARNVEALTARFSVVEGTLAKGLAQPAGPRALHGVGYHAHPGDKPRSDAGNGQPSTPRFEDLEARVERLLAKGSFDDGTKQKAIAINADLSGGLVSLDKIDSALKALGA